MIIVTGSPRSGTSLMMRIAGELLGWDSVIGDKFPDTDSPAWEADYRRQNPGCTDFQVKRFRDAVPQYNPDGYWECPRWVMNGIPEAEETSRCSVAKLTGIGLANTHPKHVDSIIYMVRDPRTQHNSMRDLAIDMDPNPDGWLRHNYACCDWIHRYKKPAHVVVLENLRSSPSTCLESLCRFLGVGRNVEPSRIVSPPVKQPDGWEPGRWWDCARDAYGLIASARFREAALLIQRTRTDEAKQEMRGSDWSEAARLIMSSRSTLI